MANISRQFADEVLLPDGTAASSSADIDRWLKLNNLALAGDYSAGFYKSVKDRQEKMRRDDLFADFISNYKRMIWNE